MATLSNLTYTLDSATAYDAISTIINDNCYGHVSSSSISGTTEKYEEINKAEKKTEKKTSSDKFMPERILYNDPATIVFWKDGTKTVVKKSKGEKFNKYNAFCAALAKKIFENNSRVNKIVQSGVNQKPGIADTKATKTSKYISSKRRTYADYKRAELEIISEKIFRMKRVQHMSYAEISRKLNMPESKVRDLFLYMKEKKGKHQDEG